MNLDEQTPFDLMNQENGVNYFKQVGEAVQTVRQDIKRKMDAGLPPDDFVKAQAALTAADCAADIVQALNS